MSIVGLYSKIQYLEAVIQEVKNAQAAASVSSVVDTTSFISGGSGDTTCVHEDKVIDLTQLKEFNELSDKVNALQIVDSELSAKIAEVPTLLSPYVPLTDFVALNAKVEKMEKLNSQMDKLNSKLDSLISKVSALESKVSSLESKVSSLESQTSA
jgi:outer membrane murein-binding lipoprotein Lpp